MSFQGRLIPDDITCTNPRASHLNICKTPWWTMFIRQFTVWQCPRCQRRYLLEWQAAGADTTKMWRRLK